MESNRTPRRVAFVYQSSAGPYTSDQLIARSVEMSASQINAEFCGLGLATIFPEAGILDACALLEGVQHVLQKFCVMRASRDELDDRIGKLCAELSHSRSISGQLMHEVEKLKKENGIVSEKARQALLKCNASQRQHRKEQEENKRLQLWLSQHSTQHTHECRRLENEIERLKSKLNQLLTSSRKQNSKDSFKIELLNPLGRVEGNKRLTWKTEAAVLKHEQDFNQYAREKLDNRLKALVAENVEMRRTVTSLHELLVENSVLPASATAGAATNPGTFQLPWNSQQSLGILKDMKAALTPAITPKIKHPEGSPVTGPSGSFEIGSPALHPPEVSSRRNVFLGSGKRQSQGSLLQMDEIKSYLESAVDGRSPGPCEAPSGGLVTHSVPTYERVSSPSDCHMFRKMNELNMNQSSSNSVTFHNVETSNPADKEVTKAEFKVNHRSMETQQNSVDIPGLLRVTVSVTDRNKMTNVGGNKEEVNVNSSEASDEDGDDDDDRGSVIMKENFVP